MRGALAGQAERRALSATAEEQVVHMDRIVEYQL